jgi:hypothetical protein
MIDGLLFRIIDRGAWEEVKQALSGRLDIRMKCMLSRDMEDGSTPLHQLMQRSMNDAPLEIIDLFLNLDPTHSHY